MEVRAAEPDEEPMARSAAADGRAGRQPGVLNLYLADTRQLFNSMDPAPFRQRDLDPEAAAYILDWAREAPSGQALPLVLHLGRGPTTDEDAAMLRKSVHEHFQRRALATRRQLQQLFRVGRYSLLIALVFLALVIVVGESDRQPDQPRAHCHADPGQPGHRRLGGAVATAGDLPLRLVANTCRSEAVRSAGHDGRAHAGARRGRARHDRGIPHR